MKRIIYSQRSKRSLKEIATWTIRRFGRAQARRYKTQLSQRIQSLAREPWLKGRSCDLLVDEVSGGITGFLYVRVESHLIIYRETEEEIQVVDFVHGSMDIERALEDLKG